MELIFAITTVVLALVLIYMVIRARRRPYDSHITVLPADLPNTAFDWKGFA